MEATSHARAEATSPPSVDSQRRQGGSARVLTATVELPGERWPVLEAFLGDPGLWLPPPARPFGLEAWLVRIHGGPLVWPVRMGVGRVWRLPDVYSRTLGWTPLSAPQRDATAAWLPDFSGRLSIRNVAGTLRLALTGVYRPPGGRLGAVLDQALLHHLASRTSGWLLTEIARHLQAPDGQADRDPSPRAGPSRTRTGPGPTVTADPVREETP